MQKSITFWASMSWIARKDLQIDYKELLLFRDRAAQRIVLGPPRFQEAFEISSKFL